MRINKLFVVLVALMAVGAWLDPSLMGGIGIAFVFPELVRVREELHAKRTALKQFVDSAKTEAGEVDPQKKLNMDGVAFAEKVKAMDTELNDIKSRHDKLVEAEQSMANAEMEQATQQKQAGQQSSQVQHPDAGGGQRIKTIGELFVESQAYKGFRRGMPMGPQVEIFTTTEEEMKAGVAETKGISRGTKTLFETATGWPPEATRVPGLVSTYPTRPAPHVIDFIPQVPTSQSSVVYMEETTFTNNATETSEGSTYGEAALALTERSVTVRKVAVFLPVTDEQLEDVAGIQAYINQRLTLMLNQRLDSQVLVGTGVMPSGLLGTENVSGIQTQALGADSLPDALYKLFTAIRDDGFAEPTVVFIRPSKWQTVQLLKTADGIYIWGHPSETGPRRIWGVPVVETTAPTATKAVAGDYAMHSFLAIRRGIEMQISSSHSTYFVEGKQAIRMDMRAAMVHLRPKGFGVVTGL